MVRIARHCLVQQPAALDEIGRRLQPDLGKGGFDEAGLKASCLRDVPSQGRAIGVVTGKVGVGGQSFRLKQFRPAGYEAGLLTKEMPERSHGLSLILAMIGERGVRFQIGRRCLLVQPLGIAVYIRQASKHLSRSDSLLRSRARRKRSRIAATSGS